MQTIESAASAPVVTGLTLGSPASPPPVVKPATPAAAPTRPSADVVAFGRDTFAVFSVDKDSGATRIAIYDGDGQLVRMIPPEGVSEMLSQLAAYRRLR